MKDWNFGDVTEVIPDVYGKILNQYDNGFETTAGLVQELKIDNSVMSITYDSDHAEQIPYGWHEMLWLDDNSKRQQMSNILWDNRKAGKPLFLMKDGTLSWTVTS